MWAWNSYALEQLGSHCSEAVLTVQTGSGLDPTRTKGIPDFWQTSLHRECNENWQAHDGGALACCSHRMQKHLQMPKTEQGHVRPHKSHRSKPPEAKPAKQSHKIKLSHFFLQRHSSLQLALTQALSLLQILGGRGERERHSTEANREFGPSVGNPSWENPTQLPEDNHLSAARQKISSSIPDNSS